MPVVDMVFTLVLMFVFYKAYPIVIVGSVFHKTNEMMALIMILALTPVLMGLAYNFQPPENPVSIIIAGALSIGLGIYASAHKLSKGDNVCLLNLGIYCFKAKKPLNIEIKEV